MAITIETAVSREIADKVVTIIAAEDWGFPFTPRRAHYARYELKGKTGNPPDMPVVPVGLEQSREGRGGSKAWRRIYRIHVGTLKKLKDPQDRNEIDYWGDFTEALMIFLGGSAHELSLSDSKRATLVEIEGAPLFFPEHLTAWGQFTSILQLGYMRIGS